MNLEFLKAFWTKNKVFILGLLSAIAGVLVEFNQAKPDYLVVAFSIFTAVVGYLANNLRGQWATILGLVSGVIITVGTSVQSHLPINWLQLVGTILVQYLAIVAPPVKNRQYESSPLIQEAKSEANVLKEQDKNTPPPTFAPDVTKN